MEISEKSIATLRALLSGNGEESQRLARELTDRDDKLAYSALMNAAFVEAVERRFTKQSPTSDVIEYVADVRSRFDEAAEAVDPHAGEQVILGVFDRETDNGINRRTSVTAKLFLLAALIADENLDSADLDRVIDKARALADRILNSDS